MNKAYLKAIDQSRNKSRFYALYVLPDLWGGASLVREYGRIVQPGTLRMNWHHTFAAEFLMQQLLEPESLSKFVGKQSIWAIPLAVFVGSPAYLDGYAALPLTRG